MLTCLIIANGRIALRHRGVASEVGGMFEMQECALSVNAGGIASQRVIAADDAVAGNDDEDGIMGGSVADGLRRHGRVRRRGGEFFGDIAVSCRHAEGNFLQKAIDVVSKRRFVGIKRWGKIGGMAGKVDIEPAACLFQNGV